MCFIIDKNYPSKIIAENDIECYKLLSLYENYKYKLGELNKSILGEGSDLSFNICSVKEGFHSYSNLTEAIWKLQLNNYSGQECIMVKCIIPKDSEYYYSEKRHEYVSNQIIIKEVS